METNHETQFDFKRGNCCMEVDQREYKEGEGGTRIALLPWKVFSRRPCSLQNGMSVIERSLSEYKRLLAYISFSCELRPSKCRRHKAEINEKNYNSLEEQVSTSVRL